RRAAHHHAFEDCLPPDCGHRSLISESSPVLISAPQAAPQDGLSANGCHVSVALAAARAAGLLQPALEPLDPATRVDELLLARVERMTVRADLHMELGLRGSRLERVPAGARHGREDIFGMNSCFHCSEARIAAAVLGATLPPETTAATVWPASSSTAPDISAAAVAAPATSQASFIRPYMKRKASRSASSVTSTDSTPSSVQTRTQLAPAYGPFSPSAIDFASTDTGSP